MAIKGVVFDFNGTLFFDTHLHNQAWDLFLAKHALILTDEEKNRKIHGKNNAEILTNLFTHKLTEEDIIKLSIEKEDIYQALCLKEKMELAPGAENFLNFLQFIGIPFTIATAADLYNLKFYFKYLNLEKYFELSRIIYSDGTVKSKPDPEIFLKAMDVLGIQASETLIFEDSASGIKAAENAKAQKIIIVNSTNDDYSRWDYDVIRSFSEVDQSLFSDN